MPTKRIFDLVVLSSILVYPAIGLVKMAMRRHAAENEGYLGNLGASVAVML
jgi:hypothetical protein